jgi:hypothetical protein
VARRVNRPAEDGGRPEDRGGDIRQWLIDNDLFYDTVGMPPEQYDLQPTSTKYRGSR